MIVHSSDDDVVPIRYGYDKYYEKYKDNPRFEFVRLENAGHNYLNLKTYSDEFNKEFDKWLETLNYDYKATENKEQFIEDKSDYIHKNLDRDKWCNSLNNELFQNFVDFYDEQVKK